jgi:nickel-dependent lactate racemase
MPLLTDDQITQSVHQSLATLALNGKRVLVIVPDQTRTMPLPLFFRAITGALLGKAAAVDFIIALGTHPPMSEEELLHLMGLTAQEKASTYKDVRLINHDWQNPEALTFKQAVPVRLNKLILDYDELLVCGPVFPHEVAGYSGGNKYFFPGIAGSDIIDFTHWLGALITSYEIIGTADTPVRQVIDQAATFIPRPRHAFCSVVSHHGVEGLFFGTPESAWRQAADLSAQTHVRYVAQPYQQVLSVLPEMYTEIWVGAKGMYKMEPVIAEGGEVIIYAPHIKEISVVHGKIIHAIGYHVRDYFVKQWEQFKHYPWGVLAHSTHLRGIGTYDADTHTEHPRITVTLATAISESECQAVNLNYRDPASIDVAQWQAQADPHTLVVPRAGEYLYRLKS